MTLPSRLVTSIVQIESQECHDTPLDRLVKEAVKITIDRTLNEPQEGIPRHNVLWLSWLSDVTNWCTDLLNKLPAIIRHDWWLKRVER